MSIESLSQTSNICMQGGKPYQKKAKANLSHRTILSSIDFKAMLLMGRVTNHQTDVRNLPRTVTSWYNKLFAIYGIKNGYFRCFIS